MRCVLSLAMVCMALGLCAKEPPKCGSLRNWRAPALKAAEKVRGFIWVEAESFAHYGKWRLDTQFVHKMGSAYLLAPGAGVPVEDAVTRVRIPRSAIWRVWVRTKDWSPDHSPGKFVLTVAGFGSRVLGAAGKSGWRWEAAGDFELAKSMAELRLVDKSGYFARCDAILLTTDLNYTPPEDADALAAERQRLLGLPTEAEDGGEYDVVVVGAGPTGMGAAVAAARNGANTALVFDRPVLGGNASAELGVGIHGASHPHPNAREGGLIEEVKLIRAFRNLPNNSLAYAVQAEGEKNLRLFPNNRVLKVDMAQKGHIDAVLAKDTLTGRWIRYRGKMFIDCTGDGWVGYFAGVPYRFGREGKADFGEDEAPEQADRRTMSGVIITDGVWSFAFKDEGHPVDYVTPEWARVLPKDFRRNLKPTIKERGGFRPSWWIEHSGDVDDLEDPEGARDELVKISFAYFGWGKNEWEHRELLRNHSLVWVPFVDGRRETMRLMGDYILTGNDQKSAKMFSDRISYGGWPMDTHDPLGMMNPNGNGYWKVHPNLPIYSIPYRILFNSKVDNLFFAGRCSSTSHMALGSVRVESTLATLGQACGTAAGLCLEKSLTPRQLGEGKIGELQQLLLKQDQYIPNIRNEDANDLARKAKVSATSAQKVIRFQPSSSVSWAIGKFKIGFRHHNDSERPGWQYSEHASPEAVIDGVSRIVGHEAHAWVSDEKQALPQAITLTWRKPVELQEVRLTFNSDLMPAFPKSMPEQLIKSYAVEVLTDGKWETIAEDGENWRRLAIHRFAARKASALRVVCRETWGSPSAQIFEIRAY